MRLAFLQNAAWTALAAGIVFGQAPGGKPNPDVPSAEQGRQALVNRQLEQLAQAFDLTDSQKEQARAIFEQAERSTQPVRHDSQQNLDELTAAAKAGKNEAEIQKLAQEQGRLLGQLLAIRTEAWAKFYQMLTLDQRAKAERAHEGGRPNAPSKEHTTGP
jgi:Spy/CpxP family protein refolding chaperone